ncbi:peptidase M23 [Metabacillus herbersteinensis]|uniref:Peptidase M23 n=1 Tax=Metabacillus herbersteinensis TaxID=283816 RepID=A0ABV6GJA5_9BACI
MSHTLRTMFFIVIFAGLMSLQYNLDSDRTSTRQIKNALELATHDAALALDESQLSQGRIVFDQERALDNLRDSLNANLKLESAAGYLYSPNTNSFYQEDIVLEHIEFVDDSNSSFPTQYSNLDYDILDTLNGPSVIAVLSTRSPRYFAGSGIIIRKAVVYEYVQ